MELTEEEKAQARKDAIKRAENEAYQKMAQRKFAFAKKESKNNNNGQMTLLF